MQRDSKGACVRLTLCVSVWVQCVWVCLVGVLCWGMSMYTSTCRPFSSGCTHVASLISGDLCYERTTGCISQHHRRTWPRCHTNRSQAKGIFTSSTCVGWWVHCVCCKWLFVLLHRTLVPWYNSTHTCDVWCECEPDTSPPFVDCTLAEGISVQYLPLGEVVDTVHRAHCGGGMVFDTWSNQQQHEPREHMV